MKDRNSTNGVSSRLGENDTPFEGIFSKIKSIKSTPFFVLETPIFNDWETEARSNLKFVKKWVETLQ